jgi:hypothetical protein
MDAMFWHNEIQIPNPIFGLTFNYFYTQVLFQSQS